MRWERIERDDVHFELNGQRLVSVASLNLQVFDIQVKTSALHCYADCQLLANANTENVDGSCARDANPNALNGSLLDCKVALPDSSSVSA